MKSSDELISRATALGEELTEEGLSLAEIAYVGLSLAEIAYVAAILSGSATAKAFGIGRG